MVIEGTEVEDWRVERQGDRRNTRRRERKRSKKSLYVCCLHTFQLIIFRYNLLSISSYLRMNCITLLSSLRLH